MSKRRIEALVDFLDVEVETLAPTNFQTVQRALGGARRVYVEALNIGEGSSASKFRLRLHDVGTFCEIERRLASLRSHVGLHDGFRIVRLEVAVDVYCSDPASQTADFFKFLSNPVSDNRRLYREARDLKSFAPPASSESFRRYLSEGWQVAIGNRGDDEYWHAYVKESDTDNGQRQKVLSRARQEIRLAGAALPCQTYDAWANFKFERLMNYFRQRALRPDLDAGQSVLARASAQVGERKVRNRREGGVRMHSRLTQADSVLNEAIRQALKNLSSRWGRVAKRGCSV